MPLLSPIQVSIMSTTVRIETQEKFQWEKGYVISSLDESVKWRGNKSRNGAFFEKLVIVVVLSHVIVYSFEILNNFKLETLPLPFRVDCRHLWFVWPAFIPGLIDLGSVTDHIFYMEEPPLINFSSSVWTKIDFTLAIAVTLFTCFLLPPCPNIFIGTIAN